MYDQSSDQFWISCIEIETETVSSSVNHSHFVFNIKFLTCVFKLMAHNTNTNRTLLLLLTWSLRVYRHCEFISNFHHAYRILPHLFGTMNFIRIISIHNWSLIYIIRKHFLTKWRSITWMNRTYCFVDIQPATPLNTSHQSPLTQSIKWGWLEHFERTILFAVVASLNCGVDYAPWFSEISIYYKRSSDDVQ